MFNFSSRKHNLGNNFHLKYFVLMFALLFESFQPQPAHDKCIHSPWLAEITAKKYEECHLAKCQLTFKPSVEIFSFDTVRSKAQLRGILM